MLKIYVKHNPLHVATLVAMDESLPLAAIYNAAEILEQIIWHDNGLVPLKSAAEDVNSIINRAGLSEADARLTKRKFRKAWRRSMKLTAKQRRRRKSAFDDEVLSGVGQPPRKWSSVYRKQRVTQDVRYRAVLLASAFGLSLDKPAV